MILCLTSTTILLLILIPTTAGALALFYDKEGVNTSSYYSFGHGLKIRLVNIFKGHTSTECSIPKNNSIANIE